MNTEIHEVEVHATSDGTPVLTENYEFLGTRPKEMEMAKEKLHQELALRWGSYLQDGIQKENKEKIIQKYPLFQNCPLLKTPDLGPEISTCLNEKCLRQDKFLLGIQDQTGHALAALGSHMNKLLEDDKNKENITILADVSQLICNIHHAISTHRRYNILPFLNYSSRKLAETSKVDEFLFGTNFVSEVKATHSAKKTSLELKAKPYVKPSISFGQQFQRSQPERKSSRFQQDRRNLNYKRPQMNVKKKYPQLNKYWKDKDNRRQQKQMKQY